MKARKQILGLLLSAFVFIVMHDFIMVHIDPETQTELYMHKIENVALCETSTLHELIHQALMSTVQLFYSDTSIVSSKTWVSYEIDNTFSSRLKHKLYRPPIA
ncbi:MAG TPA: hypothetical protein EYH01_03920 [Campylobacterales bacterium]|nr:hypothetical protein [Campylobacterales bacterium]